jgi:hypothetical protein
MECASCGALYEFKATPDLRSKMQEGILSVDGGTLFGSYHALKREEKKMFLVLVDSDALGGGIAYGRALRTVFVAPIEHVSPILKPRSFILRHGSIRVFTKIFIGAIEEWFTLDPIVPLLEGCTPLQFVSDIIDGYFDDFNLRALKNSNGGNDEDDKGNGETAVNIRSMTRGELQEYRRDVKKKWMKITRIIKMKQTEELTEEETLLLEMKDSVKAEVGRCDALWLALYV